MVASHTPIADGLPGIAQIVGTLNQLKDAYGARPCIRACAVQIAAPTVDDDQPAQLARLVDFVRGAVVFVNDPVDAEFIQTPDRMLLDIARNGRAAGDCDDHCLLLASLAQALGIRCDICGVRSPEAGADPDHVICIACPHGAPVEIDIANKSGVAVAYPEKLFA